MDLQLVPSSITSATKVPDDFEDKQKWQFIKDQVISDGPVYTPAQAEALMAKVTALRKKSGDLLILQQKIGKQFESETAANMSDMLSKWIADVGRQQTEIEREIQEIESGFGGGVRYMSYWRSPDGSVQAQDAGWEPPIAIATPREDYEKKIKKIAPEKVVTNKNLWDWLMLKFDEGFRKLFGNKVADFIIKHTNSFYSLASVGGMATLLSFGGTLGAWFSGGMALLSKVVNGGFKLFGKVGLGTRIRWLVRGKNFIFNFNWAMSDNDIRKRQEAAFKTLAGKVGETAGHGLAALVCGKAVAAVAKMEAPKMLTVNPNFMVKLAELERGTWDQPSERWEETKESLNDLIRSTANVGLQVAFLEAFKNVRSIVKAGAKGLDLSWMFPGANEMVQKWGEEDGASWSFASSLESHIESVKVDWKKELLEEFAESFLDHCDEQLMAISYAAS